MAETAEPKGTTARGHLGSTELRDALLRQFEIAWALTSYHLETLTTEECLWRPADRGLHVWLDAAPREASPNTMDSKYFGAPRLTPPSPEPTTPPSDTMDSKYFGALQERPGATGPGATGSPGSSGAAGATKVTSADGNYRADWPEHEGYDLGPSSIAWLTWHMIFWWSSVIDHSFGEGTLTRHDVLWPGSADAVRERIASLQKSWREHLGRLDGEALRSTERTRFPFTGTPFSDVVAWLNVELSKNAAEIGYARFLYAVRE